MLNTASTVVGSDPFKAPEIDINKIYDEKSDIYSLGITLFYVFNSQTENFTLSSD